MNSLHQSKVLVRVKVGTSTTIASFTFPLFIAIIYIMLPDLYRNLLSAFSSGPCFTRFSYIIYTGSDLQNPYQNYKGKKERERKMSITKPEIITSAIVVLLLVILFIIDCLTPVYSDISETEYPFGLHLTINLVSTLTCFAICCLHFRRSPTFRWKLLILGMFLGLAGRSISLHFLWSPLGYDFEFHMIFGIDVVAMVVFLLLVFIHDVKITTLLALFVSSILLIYINQNIDRKYWYVMYLCIISLLIYLAQIFIYVKHFSNHWWIIAVITVVFASAITALSVKIGINGELLFLFITSIDACLALFIGLWMYAQKVRHHEILPEEQYNFIEIAGLPTCFTIKDLETATGNFQIPIGEGGSGAVFKGTMEDGSVVAVKRIKGQASGEAEFRTEITIIASLQHISLVRLLGYCLTKGGDRYLIYPFFENGSLDSWLFKDEENRALLTWTHRYCIATDVAKALAYLHHECHHQILHLDIKPANILLDSNFRALISDFGISKSIGKDESSVMTRARGTVGYLPPEMLVPNAISTKSDVYSYGMVLLELVGGRQNFMAVVDIESQLEHKSYFPKIVKERMMEGRLMEVVDPCLEQEGIREDEVTTLVRVALWCIQENPELRPSASEVVDMLEGRTQVLMPPESPMFVVKFLNVETQSITSTQTQHMEVAGLSTNTISISVQSGR